MSLQQSFHQVDFIKDAIEAALSYINTQDKRVIGLVLFDGVFGFHY
jgi:hypothetical protein